MAVVGVLAGDGGVRLMAVCAGLPLAQLINGILILLFAGLAVANYPGAGQRSLRGRNSRR